MRCMWQIRHEKLRRSIASKTILFTILPAPTQFWRLACNFSDLVSDKLILSEFFMTSAFRYGGQKCSCFLFLVLSSFHIVAVFILPVITGTVAKWIVVCDLMAVNQYSHKVLPPFSPFFVKIYQNLVNRLGVKRIFNKKEDSKDCNLNNCRSFFKIHQEISLEPRVYIWGLLKH